VPVQVRDALLKNIKRRMTPQPIKVRADVELTCFQYDGIEHIKAAMRAAQACSTEVSPVRARALLFALSPVSYVWWASCAHCKH
jgi:translation initiation factor 2 subunit 1